VDPTDEAPAGAPGVANEALGRALETIGLLATEVGPRRPTSAEERRAAELVAEQLRSRGLAPELEPFQGYPTFAAPFGVIAGLALVRPRNRALRALFATLAGAGLATEGSLVRTPLSDALARRQSQNLVATIEPEGEARRTLALVSHLDSSRSGLLFHPGTGHLLAPWINVQSAAILALAAEPLLDRSALGRAALRAARAITGAGLVLLAERELRGEDVPGANDNASGVAVTVELAAELTERPLQHTRVVLLATGCEESGLLGAQAFLRARDAAGWLFLNFDSVGGDATLRYIEREGLARKWPADRGLVALAARIAAERPDLGIKAAGEPIGLTYDATAVLARGGRALTFVAGDGGQIPHYHHPTDTSENVSPQSIGRALGVGREMIAAIDRGEADQAPGA